MLDKDDLSFEKGAERTEKLESTSCFRAEIDGRRALKGPGRRGRRSADDSVLLGKGPSQTRAQTHDLCLRCLNKCAQSRFRWISKSLTASSSAAKMRPEGRIDLHGHDAWDRQSCLAKFILGLR